MNAFIRIKHRLSTFLFFAVSALTAMDLPHQQAIIAKYAEVDKIISRPIPLIKIQGEISLRENMPLGFGSKKYIAKLNKCNIHTQQTIPLAVVNVWIGEDNWTLCMPESIKQKVGHSLEAEIFSRETKLCELLGGIINEKNREKWLTWAQREAEIIQMIKNTNNKKQLFPRIIPIDRLCSFDSAIEFENVFDQYHVTLHFTEHQALRNALQKMHNKWAIFTLVDAQTAELMKELSELSSEDDQDINDLANTIKNKSETLLNQTAQELVNEHIVEPKNPNSAIPNIKFKRSFQDSIAYGNRSKSLTYSEQSSDTVNDTVRAGVLKNKRINPFAHTREREYKRQSTHF